MSDNLWPLAHDGMKRILSSCQNRLASQARLQHQASAEQSYFDRWLKSKKNGEWNQKCGNENWNLTLPRNPTLLLALKTQKILNSSILQLTLLDVLTWLWLPLIMSLPQPVLVALALRASLTPVQGHTESVRQRRKIRQAVRNGNTASTTCNKGFFDWWDAPNPHCVLCHETLVNESMKSAHLKWHFESKHKDCIGKPLAFFKRKLSELRVHINKEPETFNGGLIQGISHDRKSGET